MQNDHDFVTEVLDRMGILGAVSARKMFGGHGIFLDGRMFALIADNELYLKADEHSRAHFDALDLPRFGYTQASGKTVNMAYHLAPEDFFEDRDAAQTWAQRAWEAALRAPAAKKVGRRKA
jgi:DNA transformation protein